MKPAGHDHDHDHHHHEKGAGTVTDRAPVPPVKPSSTQSLLMAGSGKRMLWASGLIALLWLAVAWAVSSIE